MKQVANTLHTISGLLLLLFFCGAMVLSILLGAQAYSGIARSVQQQYGERTCLSYILAKVHSFDSRGMVYLDTFEGLPAIALREEIDGYTYITYIYSYGGSVHELFATEGSGLEPIDGLEIIKGTELSFEQVGAGLILVRATSHETEKTMYISLMSGGEAE